MDEAKKMKCYKRLLYKQLVQVSGLCGPQFLSYLPKRFTHLCRALYSLRGKRFQSSYCAKVRDELARKRLLRRLSFVWRRHIGAPFWCTNMGAGNQQKHLEFTFPIKALSFHSRTSIRTHKHIF